MATYEVLFYGEDIDDWCEIECSFVDFEGGFMVFKKLHSPGSALYDVVMAHPVRKIKAWRCVSAQKDKVSRGFAFGI